MNCTYQESMAYRLVDGSLEPWQREAFADHLNACPDCRAHVADAERLEGLLRGGITPVAVPPTLAARIAQSVAAEREVRGTGFSLPFPFLGRRFVAALGTLVVAVGLVLVAAGPETVLSAVQRALFFIPGIGISAVEADNLVATAPVAVQQGDVTFTVDALLSDRRYTQVEFRVTGLPGGKEGWDKPARVGSEAPVPASKPPRAPTLRDEAGREYKLQVGSHGTGGSPSENHIKGTLTFPSLPGEVRVVELAMPVDFLVPSTVLPGSDEQVWVARIPLSPMAQSGVSLAKPQTSAATANGVTLRVAATAQENGQTVVLVEGEATGKGRVVALGGNGLDTNKILTLRDNLGRTYKYQPASSVVGQNQLKQTLYFEGLAPFAGDLTLTVQSVQVVEDVSAEITIPLAGRQPGESWILDRTVDLGGHPIRLKSARLMQEHGAPWLYVDAELGEAENGRLFSTFGADGSSSAMASYGAKDGTQMSHFGVELKPGQQEAKISLSHPLFNVEGPWVLTLK